MSLSGIQDWLKATEGIWPPRKARWLNSEAVQRFQSSYRHYRRGHWKGAKGELLDVAGDESVQTPLRSAEGSGTRDVNLLEDQFKEAFIFEGLEDPLAIQQLHQLEKYRRAYRRFRTGEDRGAQGEISKLAEHFTRDQLRLLPIAALAQYLGDLGRVPAEKLPTSRFHVHFGAGKLGIGLVLPALVAGKTPFAILQRPSDPWMPILGSSTAHVDVYVNDDCITRLRVIRKLEDLQRLGYVDEGSVDGSAGGKPPLRFLVSAVHEKSEDVHDQRLLVMNSSLEHLFIATADSFSCSLGPALGPTLQSLASSAVDSFNASFGNPPVYGCENDHKALDKLRPLLEHVTQIKECMVDRICSERYITETKLTVTAEPYPGEIVVTARPPHTIKCPFAGPNVSTPTTYGSYSYLYNRKFLLVNGTHTTFAFMTLRKYCMDPADAPGDFPLLINDQLSPTERIEVKAWAVARCLVLLHSHELDVIKYTHGLKTDEAIVECLWSYASNAIERLASVKDSTKRVLGGGVSNRYETRLKDVLETLDTFDKSVPLAAQLFRLTGFNSMAQLKQILRLLVSEAECFVTLEPKPPRLELPYLHKESARPQGPFDIIPALRYAQGYQRQFRHAKRS